MEDTDFLFYSSPLGELIFTFNSSQLGENSSPLGEISSPLGGNSSPLGKKSSPLGKTWNMDINRNKQQRKQYVNALAGASSLAYATLFFIFRKVGLIAPCAAIFWHNNAKQNPYDGTRPRYLVHGYAAT